jgi:hypothetical protein
MLWTADDFTLVFWIAVVPAFLAFAVILFGVKEPDRPAGVRNAPNVEPRKQTLHTELLFLRPSPR